MAFTGTAERKKFARRGFAWIPPPMDLKWKVTIAGTDVTEDLFNIKYSLAVTEEIGQCNITLNNNADAYSYSGGEEIKIYLNRQSEAWSLKWKGEIEKVEKSFMGQGKTLKIVGRHDSAQLMDITVTKSTTDTIENILTDIVNDYATGFTYDKSTYPCSTTVTVTWENKPFWDCVVDLTRLSGYDCYVNNSDEFVFFERGTKLNTDEAIVHDNALSIKGLGDDSVDIRNRVIVNGKDSDGTPIVYTAEDSSSQSTYHIKEKIITDTSINTVSDAKARAEAELSLLKDATTAGEVTALIMPKLNPGDKIWISYPMLNIHDKYRVVKFETDIFKMETKVWINSIKTIPDLFKQRMQREMAIEEINNPEKMAYSFNDTFDNENYISTKTNVQVENGVLKTTSGNNTGTMISTTTAAANNITKAYIIVKGTALTNNAYWVSNNGGSTWESITPKTLHTFTSTGKTLRFKMGINSSTTEVESYSLMYM